MNSKIIVDTKKMEFVSIIYVEGSGNNFDIYDKGIELTAELIREIYRVYGREIRDDEVHEAQHVLTVEFNEITPDTLDYLKDAFSAKETLEQVGAISLEKQLAMLVGTIL